MINRWRNSIVCDTQSLRLPCDLVVGDHDFLTGVVLGDSCEM